VHFIEKMEGISKPVEVEKIVDEYDITQYE
jgi:hypothetical protein